MSPSKTSTSTSTRREHADQRARLPDRSHGLRRPGRARAPARRLPEDAHQRARARQGQLAGRAPPRAAACASRCSRTGSSRSAARKPPARSSRSASRSSTAASRNVGKLPERHRRRHPRRVDRLVRPADRRGLRHQRRRRVRRLRRTARERQRPARRARLDRLRRRNPQGHRRPRHPSPTTSTGAPSTRRQSRHACASRTSRASRRPCAASSTRPAPTRQGRPAGRRRGRRGRPRRLGDARRLVDHGRMRAESLGWTDVYTLTKAFAERAAEELWSQSGHRLQRAAPLDHRERARSTRSPAGSTASRSPTRSSSPTAAASCPTSRACPTRVLDIIPVDLVVNAIIAVAGTRRRGRATSKYYQVSSGRSNPLPFHEMYENVHEYFTNEPAAATSRATSRCRSGSSPAAHKVEKALEPAREPGRPRREAHHRASAPSTPRTRGWLDTIKRTQHGLEVLRGYTELYRAYVQTEIIFDDHEHPRAARVALARAARRRRASTSCEIDWHHYLQDIHFPVDHDPHPRLRRAAARPRRRAAARCPCAATSSRSSTSRAPCSSPTSCSSTSGSGPDSVPRKRRWRTTSPTSRSRCREYLRAERRDRGEFIRTFMRRYKGFKVADIQRLVRGSFGRALHEPRAARGPRRRSRRTGMPATARSSSPARSTSWCNRYSPTSTRSSRAACTSATACSPATSPTRRSSTRRAPPGCATTPTSTTSTSRQSYGYGDSHADLAWLQLLGNANVSQPRHAALPSRAGEALEHSRLEAPAPSRCKPESRTEVPSTEAEGIAS